MRVREDGGMVRAGLGGRETNSDLLASVKGYPDMKRSRIKCYK